ncbi:MAG: Amuc_1098 family type IV pilus outer membrane protein [Verrucomicrobiaceae bacterium]
MPPTLFPNDSKVRPFCRLMSALVFAFAILGLGLQSTVMAQSVSAMAEAEARRRALQVNKAADDIQKGYQLLNERKAEDALAVFKATYEALPDIPLAQEHRLVARNGYVLAGCQRAQELAATGDLETAKALVDELLAPSVAPKDPRAVELKQRLNDTDRFPPALTKKHVSNVEAVQALLIKANSFLEIGDPDKAIATYQEVLRIDPYNSTARRGMEKAEQDKQRYYKAAYDHQRSKMLSEVDKTWEDPLPRAQDMSAMFGAAQTQTSQQSGRQSITDKLRTLVFPQVEFAGATLDEVAELLRVRSRDLDPQGKGVSFIINVPPESRNKPISLNLSNVPMEEVLRYVSEMCGVTYRVEEHAVLFVSVSDRDNTIITRSFRVPPDFIQSAPAGTPAAATPADPFANQTPAAGGGLVIRRMGAREFLEGRGVTFPEGTSASFNSATSTLTVRNTLQNMEMVETLVEEASKTAPKLAVVQVRMLEVNQKNLDELGFDWLLGGVGMNGNNVFLGGGSTGNGNAYSPANFPFSTPYTTPALFVNDPFYNPPAVDQVFPPIAVNGAFAGPVPTGTTAPFPYGGGPIASGLRSGSYAVDTNSIDNLLQTGTPVGNRNVAPGVFSVAGVFTDPQFQSVMRALSQKKGIDINASPSVTTKNGLKATVEVVKEFIYPTEFDPPQLPQGGGGGLNTGGSQTSQIATPTTPTAFEMRKTGVLVDVEPIISDDGRTVELTIAPELTDFEGFVNYGSPIYSPSSTTVLPIQWGPGATSSYVPISQPERLITPNLILQPIFKTQKVSTAVKIWDGATIVLGGAKIQRRSMVNDQIPVLGNLPFVGRFFRSEVTQTETKNIIIFVTVSVVDPSGQKINRDTAAVAR